MKILFSGGGTLGPVTPLLAIRDIVANHDPSTTFVWIGTKKGPERIIVEHAEMRFLSISSGKWRRYNSFLNITDIYHIFIGFFQSLVILWNEHPDICISAGGYVSVPVHFAAWLLGIPTWVHQQDIQIGLANKYMAPLAKIITTALQAQTSAFSKKKTFWLGNPVRSSILSGSRDRAISRFHLNPTLPTVFVTGGGTGSARVNQLIVESLQHLNDVCNVIHLSGKERPKEATEHAAALFKNYHVYSFFTGEMSDAYAVSDVVISRGGFGTLAEIAALNKAAIIVPKPGHQEHNVAYLANAGAVVLLDQEKSNGYHLAGLIKVLLRDSKKREDVGHRLGQLLPVAKESDIFEILKRILG